MGQRREIAGSPHRPLCRDARHNAGGDQLLERLDDAVPNPGIAARKRADLERDNDPNDGVIQQRSGSGSMRQNERTLQVREPRWIDAGPRE